VEVPEAPHSFAEVGSKAGGYRFFGNAEGNLRIAAWGFWPIEVIRVFGAEAPAATQTLTRTSVFVFDGTDLKPQGTEGQEAIRMLFHSLTRLPFAKGLIIRGNAMTCMQLARLLRECGAERRLEFADTLPFGT